MSVYASGITLIHCTLHSFTLSILWSVDTVKFNQKCYSTKVELLLNFNSLETFQWDKWKWEYWTWSDELNTLITITKFHLTITIIDKENTSFILRIMISASIWKSFWNFPLRIRKQLNYFLIKWFHFYNFTQKYFIHLELIGFGAQEKPLV